MEFSSVAFHTPTWVITSIALPSSSSAVLLGVLALGGQSISYKARVHKGLLLQANASRLDDAPIEFRLQSSESHLVFS